MPNVATVILGAAVLAALLTSPVAVLAGGTGCGPGGVVPRPSARAPADGAVVALDWSSQSGRVARAALARAISGGAAFGLLPRAYGLPAPDDAAVADLVTTRVALRFAHDLRDGRVAPTEGDPDWHIVEDRPDLQAQLHAAHAGGALDAFFRGLAPTSPEFAPLAEALVRYRAMGAATSGAAGFPASANGIVEPGDARWSALVARLRAEGFIGPDETSPTAAEVEAAIRAFQGISGLAVDGRAGPMTQRALAEPVARRAGRIAAALERLRWMPRRMPARHVYVSIPAQFADLMENGRGISPSSVVIGERRHPTPSFRAAISGFVLNPPWNVPATIAAREILPRLKRDPGHLERNDIRIVGRDHDLHGHGIDWTTYRTGHFPFRLRQEPGPLNPLGLIRFDMPNPHDTYLHDTPLRSAFRRADRALSHGCIRLEDAIGLAAAIAGEDRAAFEARARLARERGETVRHALSSPVPVFVVYRSVGIDDQGRVRFASDPYGRDEKLAVKLAAADR